MQLHIITANESGQRLDKYLKKLMPEAQSSFYYKMLRKKNITLNEKKADGKEKVVIGDEIRLFLAEDTIAKFRGISSHMLQYNQYEEAYKCYHNDIQTIFENEHVLVVNKPAGILTQKAKEEDLSLNEYLIGYLLATDSLTKEELATFKPSVCNRLDRNTSGLVICGKSLLGLQVMGNLIKERYIQKFYRCIVTGIMKKEEKLEGYLYKDEKTNKVTITKEETKDSAIILTNYKPIVTNNQNTLLEVELITGKTHQIRAHLASIKHPIIGDFKYGNQKINHSYQKNKGISCQLLHAYRLEFKEMPNELEDMKNLVLVATMPKIYTTLMEESNGNMEF